MPTDKAFVTTQQKEIKLGYAERFNLNETPRCFGHSECYDDDDTDCKACKHMHTCRQEVTRLSAAAMPRVASAYTPYRPSVSTPIRPTYTPSYSSNYRHGSYPGADMSSWEPGPMHDKDPAVKRFFKDGAAGAARGLFYEFWRFWTVFRLK